VVEDFDWQVFPLREAWREAAEDLGIRVVTDGCFLVEDSGERHPVVAAVPDFAGGMHVFDTYDERLFLLGWVKAHGSTVVELGGGYDPYDRATFIEMLNDWDWTGDGDAPEWHVYNPPPEDD
jgi:hypothetical protein